MVTLETYIAHSEPSQAHKFTEHEINQIADSVRSFVKSREESVEGLFNPDDDHYIGVVLTKDF